MDIPKLIWEETSRKQWGKVILERKFQLPSGKVIEYFNWGGTVIPSIIFPVTSNLEVVALKQFRYGANEVVIEIPGGCSYEDKDIEEAARKELEEETGYTAVKFIKLGPPIWFEPANYISPYFPVLAKDCVKIGEPKPDETEFFDISVWPLKEWIEKIYSGEIRDSKTIVVTFLAMAELGWRLNL